MIYLTGVTSPAIEAALAARGDVALLTTPDTRYSRTDVWPAWAADNGMFGHWSRAAELEPDPEAEAHSLARWLADPVAYEASRKRGTLADRIDAWATWLESFSQAQRAQCLFATAPDTPFVERAWDGSHWGAIHWSRWLRERGYQVAMVAQDGLEEHLASVRWDLVDWVFLGGSTDWKLSGGAAKVADWAVRREGKRVHMGRVNSQRRLGWAEALGCTSADGTFLGFGPRRNVPQLQRWLDAAA